ncbi:MAG: hypothetical protein U0521_17585 [Anaerolineae bacterium]
MNATSSTGITSSSPDPVALGSLAMKRIANLLADEAGQVDLTAPPRHDGGVRNGVVAELSSTAWASPSPTSTSRRSGCGYSQFEAVVPSL